MNVLLLGNGFDINVNLPTKYCDFLHTVEYLINESATRFRFVGEVFSSQDLQIKNSFIMACYNKHKEAFDETVLAEDEIDKLVSIAQKNIWFTYLLNSFNKDVGWIDFEREIATVIHSFQRFLPGLQTQFYDKSLPTASVDRYIINRFSFFYQQTRNASVSNTGQRIPALYAVDKQYIIEYPLGSGIQTVNCERIIETLEDELKALAQCLQLYLRCFVEKPVEILVKKAKLTRIDAFKYTNQVITFNYTHTYEKLYSCDQVFHIHGDTNKTIVLGVNPDKSDEGENIDTSFLKFKKYYQRTVNKSDSEYLRWLVEQQDNTELIHPEKISLLIMGHSLDVTDRDIIEELFLISNDITILYHNDDALSSMVTNLVRIFGREKFYNLRTKNKLTFLYLGSDYTEYLEGRKITSKTIMEHQLELLQKQSMTFV